MADEDFEKVRLHHPISDGRYCEPSLVPVRCLSRRTVTTTESAARSFSLAPNCHALKTQRKRAQSLLHLNGTGLGRRRSSLVARYDRLGWIALVGIATQRHVHTRNVVVGILEGFHRESRPSEMRLAVDLELEAQVVILDVLPVTVKIYATGSGRSVVNELRRGHRQPRLAHRGKSAAGSNHRP